MRHHIEVHASHREQVWESPSASLIEQDPEVIPDVDIAAQVGKDLFLDEKIPRHESGQGYVRVLEKSIMWRETETAKVFTYQGLTTCTELDKNWTIMSSTYNHLRQGRDKGIDELKVFIRTEVELQERLEATGYRPPTWRLLRALQSLLSAVQLQGESAVTAPPFFPSAPFLAFVTDNGFKSVCQLKWVYSITHPHSDVHRNHPHPHHTPLVNGLQHLYARN